MDCRALHDLLLDLPLDPATLELPSLPAAAEVHLGACEPCRTLRASYARLDQLLVTEPAPPAPPELVTQVLEAVAVRRARDLAWARRQVLVLVAAAALLVAGLGLALGGWSDVVTSTARARADVEAGAAALGASIDAALVGAWGAGERLVSAPGLPSPPVVLLLALAPALLLLDSIVCRGPGQVAGRTS